MGYVVQVHSGPVYRRGGVTFVIQSPVAPTDVLEQKIVDFVDHQIRVIEAFTKKDFDVHKRGLIDILLESDKNLSDRSSRYWNDLDLGVHTFDSNQKIADEVANLSKRDMAIFIRWIRSSLEDERLLVFSRGKFDTVPVNGAPL